MSYKKIKAVICIVFCIKESSKTREAEKEESLWFHWFCYN